MTKLNISFSQILLFKCLVSTLMFVQSVLLIWVISVFNLASRLFYQTYIIRTKHLAAATEFAILLHSTFTTRSWMIHCLHTILKEILTYMHLMRLVITAHLRLISGPELIALHLIILTLMKRWNLAIMMTILRRHNVSVLLLMLSKRLSWTLRNNWYKFDVIVDRTDIENIIFVFSFLDFLD
jgi:hypothetical protein